MKPDPVDLLRYRTIRICEGLVTLAALLTLVLVITDVFTR